MTESVDKYKPKGYGGSDAVDDTETDAEYEDYVDDSGDVDPLEAEQEGYGSGYSNKNGPAQGYGTKGYGGTSGSSVAGGGSVGSPASPEEYSYLAQLAKQPGMTFDKAAEMFYNQFGYYPTKADYNFAKQGYSGSQGPVPFYQNTGYGSQVNNFMKGYGGTSQDMMKFFGDQQMQQQMGDQVRSQKKSQNEEQRRIHMVMLLVMMGEISMAVREMCVLQMNQAKQMNRILIEKKGMVSDARSMVIRNFAKNKPPRAYAGKNPDTAARAQDKSAKYNQFVQLNVQLMGELQNSDKELADAIVTINRDVDTMWQMTSEMAERESRTKEKIVSR